MNLQTIQKLVINLPTRTDRLASINAELPKLFFNPSFYTIKGITKFSEPRLNVIEAHKKAIRAAEVLDLPEVLVIEDDLKLSDSKGLINFVNDAFNNLPEHAEILLGGIYGGNPKRFNAYWSEVSFFAGATFVVYKSSVYEKILNYDFGPNHFDRVLSSISKCYVISPMIAKQFNGYSDNRQKDVDDEHYLVNYKFF